MTSPGIRHARFFALVAAVVLVAAACQNIASTPRGQIEGTVVNRLAGTAVEGTTVRVVDQQITTTTNADGRYSLEVPAGTWTLEFAQEGYATSRVEGVVVEQDETTRQDVIQAEAFDPAAPAEAPAVAVSVEDGDEIAGDPDDDTFTFDIEVTVADPDLVQPYFVTASLGQRRGTSGYLNQFVPGQIVGQGQASVEASLSATGFDGPTTLHVVAYDSNMNRTEVIRRVTVESSVVGAAPVAPENLTGTAITFGDVGVFGSLAVPPSVTGAQLEALLNTGDLQSLAPLPQALPTEFDETARADIGTQSYLDEVVTWVDLYYDYTFASTDEFPVAFEVFRSLGDDEFRLIGRVSPFQAHLDGTTFGFRDATASLQAGVEATYRVEAVTGEQRAASETFAVTPLGPFYVTAENPSNGEDFTSVTPTYEMSYSGTSDEVFIGALVFDRVHAEDNFLEWGVVGLTLEDDGVVPGVVVTDTGAAIPHNVDGTAVTAQLQAYHAYDWSPIAVTHTSDMSAISIASDFYDFFEVGFGVTDGPWSTFLTGDGSF